MIIVDDPDRADPRRCEVEDRRTADAACANYRDISRQQPGLTRAANLLEDDMAGVSFQLLVGKGHEELTPVDPKPPEPLTVSSSSCTSANCATCTGAATNCAMRSPRAITKGSAPRLMRMTFSSPR